MATVRTGTDLRIVRKTREESNAIRAEAAMVSQNQTIEVTFVAGTTSNGQSKSINGQTYNELDGTWTFSPDTLEIPYGDTSNIKIKMNNNGSTNGWRLYTFTPKGTNPSGGPGPHSADANGEINFTDNNTVAGTYYYGIEVISASAKQYSDYDPAIKQDGGGTTPPGRR